MHNWRNNLPNTDILIAGADTAWNGTMFEHRIRCAYDALRARRSPNAPVAICADNSPEWIAIDLAAQELGITLVPLPFFFTAAQLAHAIRTAGVQAIFCMQTEHAHAFGFTERVAFDGALVLYESVQEKTSAVLGGVQKVTFTSGTTAEPKGVCLSAAQQWEVAYALQQSLAELNIRRHLNLLPLAVLLENVAGVYTALLSHAINICLPLAETGLVGASRFDPNTCLDAIQRHQAESIILLPQMLQALVATIGANDPRIQCLKYVAVGGARTPAALIQAAREKGFPVYEGYGLSECGSVVSINRPGADCIGSAGKVLPNRFVRIAADGEIEVGGQGVARYLGEAPHPSPWLATGDLGRLDDNGFLHIDGRKKNILITAYGRNISPEWPESVLLGTGAIAQAVVFGDGQPYLVAALVPLAAHIDDARMQSAVDQANSQLPDYARVQRWFRVEPFTAENQMATANGRPRREVIWHRYQQQIVSAYATSGE